MAQISTNQFRNGTHIEIDGAVYRILGFQHVKPGKGGAFVRTKVRKLDDGTVHDKTFRAGERPAGVQLPSAVELKVTETQPGVKGDTASGGGTKPATLESGVSVQVPLFVEEGDTVRVDTRSGEYVSRV